MSSNKFSLVFFDLDGTLTDTSIDLANGVNYAMDKLGKPHIPPEKVTRFVGNGAKMLIKRCLPDADETFVEDAYKYFYEHYDKHLVDNTVLYPDIKEALPLLTDVVKTVVTNKPEGMSRKILAHFGITSHFVKIIGGDTLPTKKPAPDALLSMMSEFGVSKKHSLMVGDSIVDIETAKAADVPSLVVMYGFQNDGVEEANYTANSFKEVYNFIRTGKTG
ncbi:MAG: hypothetical protein A2W23_01055 [Planctomycetes bacterium RBG_16_43_13]|nr:MAG: hypothetical protein A2W23_01055 [Planctomycetes bacterium RBG_16_43_13]